MKKNVYTLAAIGTAVLALSACGTASTATAAPAHQHGHTVEVPTHAHHTTAQTASLSPAQAISIAQKQAGGRATEIHLKGKYGAPVYEVEVRSGQREHTVYVDAANGKVLGSKLETEWKPMRQAALPLERAIEIAQSKINGRVLEAERDSNRGQIVYKVEILSADNIPYKVIVDANNGNVLASFVDYDD